MAEIIWTETAFTSLEEIAEYIALDNPVAANKLISRILSETDRLADFPESGRIIPELADLPYRELIINPCRVLYKHESITKTVYILNVVRQERHLLRYLQRQH